MANHRALAARVARLEARKATGTGCWLVEVPPGSSDAEVEAAVAAHRAATGWTGGVVVTVPQLSVEEWQQVYGATIGSG